LLAWKDFSKDQLLKVYRTMLLSRSLDDKMLIMLRQGKSFFHIGAAGHEAAQVAGALALKAASDWAYPYYRDQAFVLAWGVTPTEILLNFLARGEDPSSGGRQMPQHFGHQKLRIVTQSSPTGSQYLQAVGTAMGCRKLGTNEVVYVSSGEGATSQGDFYEAINWATRDCLPVIFLVEDNQYAISVPSDQQAAGGSVYEMVMGYKNLHRHQVNGLDVGETYETFRHCISLARANKGPSLIVARVVRLLSHSSSDDQRKYRDHAELDEEKNNDPIAKYQQYLLQERIAGSEELEDLRKKVISEVNAAADAAEAKAMPDTADVQKHLFAACSATSPQSAAPAATAAKVVMIDAINHALMEEMSVNDRVILYGEDVADPKGGVFTATKGLSTRFGDERVFNAPLAESSIIGTAIGLAIRGFKPVVEIQFSDYIWTAMMQIRNELATVRWRSNGAYAAPVVVRAPVGGYIHGGLCHSQNVEGFFAHLPGLYICYPSNAADAKGLLKQAIRSEDPVLFLEHKALYRQSYAMSPEPGNDYLLPFGRAVVRREGKDLTVVTYGALVQKSLQVAAELAHQGVEIEVIDIRTIHPLDTTTILESVTKTNRVLVAHEDSLTGGFGGEIVAIIADQAFEYLDAPIKRIAAMDIPVPFNWKLEAVVLPQEEHFREAINELISY
jgi:2-oxoisovalerate dehydrogenase E1 component